MNSSVYWADHADPAMAEAVERARRSFRFFWRELSWERRRIIPALDMAAIKLPFATPRWRLRAYVDRRCRL